MPQVGDAARYRRITRGLWVGILTAAYMTAVGGEIPVYDDTIQDMLRARDGEAFGIFQGGSPTTFDPIQQGQLWIRFLAATFALGLGAVAQQVIMLALAAVSVALFDAGVREHFGEDVGWELVGVFLPILLVAIVYPIATAGYLGPPVLVGSTLALLHVVTSGSTRAACVCGASLAFVAELHPVALLGAPIVVLTIVASSDRPVRALLFAIASGIISALAISFHPWVENGLSIIGEPGLLALAAGALAGAILVAARGRQRWRALDVGQRRLFLLIGIVASVAAEVVAASLIAQRAFLMPHYLLFAFPAMAILAALALRRLRNHGRVGRLVAHAIPVALLTAHLIFAAAWKYGVAAGTLAAPVYSMREAEILARHFWEMGLSFPDVQRHLRGPQSYDLMGGIAIFAPSPTGPLERSMRDIRVLAFDEVHRPESPLPDGGEELDLGHGRRAWILPIDGWVRLAPSRVCFEPVVADKSDCIEIDSDSIAYGGLYRDLYTRSFPRLRESRWRVGGGSFRWELPVEITGNDRERHFELAGLFAVPWVIERVEGVAYRGELPARQVVLARSKDLSGRIVLAPASNRMSLKEYPPDFLETRPSEAALRGSLQRLPPLGHFVCTPHGTCPDRARD